MILQKSIAPEEASCQRIYRIQSQIRNPAARIGLLPAGMRQTVALSLFGADYLGRAVGAHPRRISGPYLIEVSRIGGLAADRPGGSRHVIDLFSPEHVIAFRIPHRIPAYSHTGESGGGAHVLRRIRRCQQSSDCRSIRISAFPIGIF